MTHIREEAWPTLALVCVAIGSCALKEAVASINPRPTSTAQYVRTLQFEDAMRETFHAEQQTPDCARRLLHLGPARGDGAVTCITQMQLDRMREEAKP